MKGRQVHAEGSLNAHPTYPAYPELHNSAVTRYRSREMY